MAFLEPAGTLSAWVAQLVEQRIENPRVGGSNPPPGTTLLNLIIIALQHLFSLLASADAHPGAD